MAADPTLADRVLADQLERHAAQRFVGEPVSGMCRAAAVRLRKLDAAITDVRAEFAQALSDDTETSGFLNWIERLDTALADALGGTE